MAMVWPHSRQLGAGSFSMFVVPVNAPQEVLLNVAPKKANWDLRRDIADKLAKLERRTQVPGSGIMMMMMIYAA